MKAGRLGSVLVGGWLMTACGAAAPAHPAGGSPAEVALSSAVPGLRVQLMGLVASGNEVTARFRVTNGGANALRSRVFGDPAVKGFDRQLGRDLGGAFLFDTAERALYAPLRSPDDDKKVRGDALPAAMQPGQTVEVSVTFQKPATDVVDVGFPTAVPFLRRRIG